MLLAPMLAPQPGLGLIQQLSGTSIDERLALVLNQPLANQSWYDELPQQRFYNKQCQTHDIISSTSLHICGV